MVLVKHFQLLTQKVQAQNLHLKVKNTKLLKNTLVKVHLKTENKIKSLKLLWLKVSVILQINHLIMLQLVKN
ncbi:MAG: hypothetical protein CMF74_18055 [Maricaulis sp.]|nr:hypothetical protein [Maricaulis sp.]